MNTETDPSDSELLQSMQAGNEDALAALYRRRARDVYRFALQLSGSRALADDVTQEVFMVLIHDGHTFDPARGSLNAFLLGVARNHVLRRQRRERFYVSMEDESENGAGNDKHLKTTVGPLDNLARTETIESVRRTVLALPERYREVVVLCELQELSYVEAAEILGCAVGTVRSRLHRARALLMQKLRPAAEEDCEEREEESAASAATKAARCFDELPGI